ncbi:MAG: hypothetical protein M1419_02625 [Bacteroidetes bacterium]|nr:hypothetical protein [Bacteroidota bacterium]
MVIILFIIPGCNGEPIQPPPPEPTIFADVSGYDSLHFETVAMATFNKYKENAIQLNIGGSYDIGGKRYALAISVFYLDTILATGTFKFRPTKISNEEYAGGSFVIKQGDVQKEFKSDSGIINITELNESIIKGTFNFFGSDLSKTQHIKVQNGILNIK